MASDYQRAALRAAAAARRPARRARARRRPRCAPRAILLPGPSAPPRDCALQDDRPTTSHPHTHFGRAGKDDGSLRQYVRRHSLDFESRSPSGRLRRSSVDAIPSLDSISETPATADVAD